jgi:hypothetical protein
MQKQQGQGGNGDPELVPEGHRNTDVNFSR